jgi:hypothetical protein
MDHCAVYFSNPARMFFHRFPSSFADHMTVNAQYKGMLFS